MTDLGLKKSFESKKENQGADLGLNLSGYQNLTVLSARTPDEMKKLLDQIRLPFQIKFMFPFEGRICAFIVPSRPIKKKLKEPKGV